MRRFSFEKTEKSRRTIALPDFALDALRKHRERQEEIKRKAGEFWQEHDYVFCTPLGTHIHPGHDILEEFKKRPREARTSRYRYDDGHLLSCASIDARGSHKAVKQPAREPTKAVISGRSYQHKRKTSQAPSHWA